MTPKINHMIEAGKGLHAVGKYTEAMQCYRQAYQCHAESAELNSLIGQLLALECDFHTAKDYFLAASVLEPAEFKHVFNLGYCLQSMEDYDAAMQCYQNASMLKGQISLALSEWGHCLLHKRDFKSAVRVLKKALKFDVNHAQTWSDLGLSYMEVGKLADADRCLRKSDHLRTNFEIKYRQCRLALLTVDRASFSRNFIEALRFAASNAQQLQKLKHLVDEQKSINLGELYYHRLNRAIGLG